MSRYIHIYQICQISLISSSVCRSFDWFINFMREVHRKWTSQRVLWTYLINPCVFYYLWCVLWCVLWYLWCYLWWNMMLFMMKYDVFYFLWCDYNMICFMICFMIYDVFLWCVYDLWCDLCYLWCVLWCVMCFCIRNLTPNVDVDIETRSAECLIRLLVQVKIHPYKHIITHKHITKHIT